VRPVRATYTQHRPLVAPARLLTSQSRRMSRIPSGLASCTPIWLSIDLPPAGADEHLSD
jgi:hypothetical protein